MTTVTRHAWMDRGVAAVALVGLAPLMVLIGGAVRLTSRGPVVFAQVRVGQGGRPFRIYKFRTMVDGADRLSANVSPTGDPRVTRVGRVLRACYLDELPQLVNIVKGDMTPGGPAAGDTGVRRAVRRRRSAGCSTSSPVSSGPRRSAFMDEAERLAAAPDPEAYYRSVLMHERVRLDLAYLEKRSLSADARLVLRQAMAIVRQ